MIKPCGRMPPKLLPISSSKMCESRLFRATMQQLLAQLRHRPVSQALKTGQANLVGIFSSITPILLLPLLWLIYKRRPAVGAWLGAGMAVLGTALIMAR